MDPIVIAAVSISESLCVVPLSMPRHAQDVVVHFLPSLRGVVYGGKEAFGPKKAPDFFRQRAD